MMNNGRPRRRKVVRRIILVVLLLALVGGIGWFAYSSLKREYTTTYDTYTATTGSISNALSFSGNLGLIDSASYTASSSGTVKTVYAPAGTDVKEGDKILRLSNGETVTADFDGRVNVLGFSEGDSVAAGDTLAQIADFTHLRVAFRVDEYDISDVAVGQPCIVTVTALEKAYESTIDAIDYISASSGNVAYYSATANVEVDGDALPGMQVTVTIPKEEAKDVVILKVDALSFDRTNQAFVYMKDDAGELTQVNVTTGVSNGNYIEITSGLADGDVVYVEAKAEETGSGGLLRGLFGSRQFNQPAAGPGGSMPNRGNWSGERSNWSGERGNWSGFGDRSNRDGGNR